MTPTLTTPLYFNHWSLGVFLISIIQFHRRLFFYQIWPDPTWVKILIFPPWTDWFLVPTGLGHIQCDGEDIKKVATTVCMRWTPDTLSLDRIESDKEVRDYCSHARIFGSVGCKEDLMRGRRSHYAGTSWPSADNVKLCQLGRFCQTMWNFIKFQVSISNF